MRAVVWLVLIFAVAVVAATTLGSNDGLVSIFWSGWRVDLSLNLTVLLLIGGFCLMMVAVQGLSSLLSLPQRASAWRELRRERIAHQALRDALAEYFAARYGRARKAAERAQAVAARSTALRDDQGFATLAYTLAAGSAHRLQDRAGRNASLRAAQGEELRPPVGSAAEGLRLLAVEWALDDRDVAQALTLLEALPPGTARRTQALRLRLQAQRLGRKPLEALQTARLLAHHQAFSPSVAQSLLRSLAGEALESTHDVQQLRRLWGQFDGADRRDPLIAAKAAQRAVLLSAPEDARQWLRPFWERLGELDRDQREQLSLALMEARTGIGPDWLPRMEAAAQEHAHEPAVLAAVGMVFAERQLWGKARRLLEQAAQAPTLGNRARRACWRELAQLAREQGDAARAGECDQAAAALG